MPQIKYHATTNQWPFRKTGTMGTLTNQAEIGVWVQAPGRFYWGPGLSPPKKCWDCICKNLVRFGVL